ncbi:MAG: hypothetical protein ABW250_00635 [Pyrinomonadaceae bacterium]
MSTAVVDVEQQRSELAEAEAQLRHLERELAALPSRLSEAARAADGARLLALRQRRGEIEGEIFAARSRLLRLQIEAAEQRRLGLKRVLKEQEDELLVAAQAARVAYDEARRRVEAHGAVVMRMRFIENDAEIERVKANELRQELAALVREASGEGGEQVATYGARTGRVLTRGGDVA